ncbi:hypothetical protein AB4Z27_25980 [Cupriavidus sp. KB_39]|uniref:hypothetical protein n=1 Tax=Cupriavidus sp. KB_39 TaxID=3233036 RepID=UPI003F9118DE
MIYLGKWNSLSDAASYLQDRTGETWTERAIISRLIEIGLDTISVNVAGDIPLMQPYENERQKATPYGYAQLLQVCEVAQFLHELEIAGEARPLALVNEAGIRFKTSTPIPSSAVRLSRDEIDQLPTGFHRLVEAMKRGEYPELRALALGEAIASTEDLVPAEDTHAATPLANALGEQSAKESVATAADNDWKAVARELAQKVGEERWSRGEREITARNVSKSVAYRLGLIDPPKYWGKRGQRSESNVRNEALSGWKFNPGTGVA